MRKEDVGWRRMQRRQDVNPNKAGFNTSNFKDVAAVEEWGDEYGAYYYREYKDKVKDWRRELDDGSYTIDRFNGVAFKPNTMYLIQGWNDKDYYYYYWRPNFIESQRHYNPEYYTPHEGVVLGIDRNYVSGLTIKLFGLRIPETVEHLAKRWVALPTPIFLNWGIDNPLEVKE